MMKCYLKHLLLACTLCGASGLSAQEVIQQTFYNNKYSRVKQSKATIVEQVIRQESGVITHETRRISGNKLLSLQQYKDEIPVGKWIDGRREIDYDFELVYSESPCIHSIAYNGGGKQTHTGVSPTDSFTAPHIPDVHKLLAEKIKYPAPAREQNIQGRTYIRLTLDETGAITALSVERGAHPILDKEAVRVLRQFPPFAPARLNGKAVPCCITMPIAFRLE